MRRLLAALLLLAPLGARAENPVVRFTTSLGELEVELCAEESAVCDRAAPGTVANFLRYVDDGDYDHSVVHRSIAEFVIQGGSFRVSPGPLVTAVPTDPAVPNEFTGFPNRRGTLSVPLQGGGTNDPCDTVEDSGTSGWFVNVVDNSSSLDCGLFTVFGVVLGNGMQVVDAINQLTTLQFFFPPSSTYQFLLPLFEPDGLVTAFTNVPFPQAFVDRFQDPEIEEDPTPTEIADAFIRVDIERVPEPGAAAAGGAVAAALAALAGRRRS